MEEKHKIEKTEELDELTRARLEIASLVKEEREKGKTANFPGDFSPEELIEELTLEDLEIWMKKENKSLTRNELEAYIESIFDSKTKKLREGVGKLRELFYLYIRNMGGYVVAVKELEEAMKQQNK